MHVESMNDEELLDRILEAFEEDGRLSLHYIDVEVIDGTIILSGRVTSEEELQIIDEVLDHISIVDYKNKVWVDESLTYEDPEDKTPDIRDLNFDDDEIDDQEYEDDEEEEEDSY